MAAAQKLPSKYVKLAKAQLGEDPKNIPAHVEALRRWLSSMPHLTCPDDDDFLLMFLRQSKYVHAKAQARLDNFCTLSTMKSIGDIVWGTPLDLKSKTLDSYLNTGMHLPLNYMEDGKMCVWIRPGVWNPDAFSIGQNFYYAYKTIFMIASDPRTIIGGTVVLLDFTGGTSKQVIKDPNVMKLWARFTQEAVPLRPRRIIFYNEGKLLDTMLSVMMFYMKEKMKNRMLWCGSDIEKAFEAEPDLRAVLPPEVGGEGEPLEDLIQANKKRFLEFYGKGDPTGTIKVDESKRPVSARDFLHDYKDYNANVMGKSGTYVKVDQGEI
ncbi:Alpha-tocopherol transfer protein-like [Echinococcus granulosus]|uniref:Alpha tocopherol transfer protein n=1 Tax=Echinococcus granulosus TaxID=6210 RepID=U6ITN7_ECHGR|nr:Alpha-tocopherol transfer protein-like protein [Echinococcus granulosus]EUB59143.1 Alpha-tocopherol transfer protein-like protein [Echinococcus granulosus]KAH9285606.1 Alpha-tocopherol transfer protein-like [Echinococcus granulosus]CDS15183.1 alpha tocopherol transfer protein [Echinococcus granulosus]